ncbi:MAG: hypothetical protein WKG06_04885 [Segetibacter sp.]
MDTHLEDAGYVYGILCPKLLTYGLVKKIDVHSKELNDTIDRYETSPEGYKFLALLERYQLKQKEQERNQQKKTVNEQKH